MKRCASCGRIIALGGKKDGPHRYCSDACFGQRNLIQTGERIPDVSVEKTAQEIYNGICPSCKGSGPVDVHTWRRLISAFVLSFSDYRFTVSCKACALRHQWQACTLTFLLGWWGLPGIFITPVILVMNLREIFRRNTGGPSRELMKQVRITVAREYHEMGQGVGIETFVQWREAGIDAAVATNNQAHVEQIIRQFPGIENARLNWRRQTPLHFAASFGNLEAVRLLVKNNADTAIQDIHGYTPLRYAVEQNELEVVRLLVQWNGGVNIADREFLYPLHVAAQNGNLEMVKELVNSGANPFAEGPLRQLPSQMARKNGHMDVVRLLETKMASRTNSPRLKHPHAYRDALARIASRLRSPRVTAAAAAIIVVLLIPAGIYLENRHLLQHQELHISNMLNIPATVQIDNQPPFTISPGRIFHRDIHEGIHHIKVIRNGRPAASHDIALKNTFYERWFDDKLFIYNVMNAGVIVWEEVVYYPYDFSDKPASPTLPHIQIGVPFVSFINIDYVFSKLPDEIELSADSPKTKTAVNIMGSNFTDTVDFLIDAHCPATKIMTYMEAHIDATKSPAQIQLYQSFAEDRNLSVRAATFMASHKL